MTSNKGQQLFQEESHDDLQLWWFKHYGTFEQRQTLPNVSITDEIEKEYYVEEYIGHRITDGTRLRGYSFRNMDDKFDWSLYLKAEDIDNFNNKKCIYRNLLLELEKHKYKEYRGNIFLDCYCDYEEYRISQDIGLIKPLSVGNVNTSFKEVKKVSFTKRIANKYFFVEIKKHKKNMMSDIREIEYYKSFVSDRCIAIYSTPDELDETEKAILKQKNIEYVRII